MKIRLIKLLIVILCFIFFIPSVRTWTWDTHSDIVDSVYYGLPAEVQQKLKQ
jgi:hypothetical protein